EETPETETKISTLQTTTPTTTGVEETPETETKISTLQTTTPTTTNIETMEQKGATQVETSTLDEQKPVDTTTNRTIDLEKPNKIEEQFRDIFSNFPDYINQLYQEYQSQLQVIFFLALAILTVKLLASFVQALNRIPILSITFELIGMGYLLWFVYRYLLNQDNRQELLDKIEDIRTEIIGK
ncbi:MAG: CAAD domain-containing protein, partial [Trichodesmium sp. St2_bin2_1]|nr:CAAD domain-containing protein [Trichodesmium sp. St2_bin2_1]